MESAHIVWKEREVRRETYYNSGQVITWMPLPEPPKRRRR